jgi:hypothetical protein
MDGGGRRAVADPSLHRELVRHCETHRWVGILQRGHTRVSWSTQRTHCVWSQAPVSCTRSCVWSQAPVSCTRSCVWHAGSWPTPWHPQGGQVTSQSAGRVSLLRRGFPGGRLLRRRFLARGILRRRVRDPPGQALTNPADLAAISPSSPPSCPPDHRPPSQSTATPCSRRCAAEPRKLMPSNAREHQIAAVGRL